MPIVDPKELEKDLTKQKKENPTIETESIGDKTIYKGPDGKWYDTYGEALQAHQEHKRLEEYKRLGLDEQGRSPAQVAYHAKRTELLKKREEVLKQAREIDVKISSLKIEDFEKKDKEDKK